MAVDAVELQDWLDEQARGWSAEASAVLVPMLSTLADNWLDEQMVVTAAVGRLWSEAVNDLAGILRDVHLTAWAAARTGDLITDPEKLGDTLDSWWRPIRGVIGPKVLATAANRISDLANKEWSILRAGLADRMTRGFNNEKMKEYIESRTDYTEFRADTIARTEVQASYSEGNWQAQSKLVADGDGPIEKVWVAAIDARTRDSHRRAHDEVVPFAEPFRIGGASMMYPLDRSGPPEEVINCRCIVEYLYAGDTRPDGSIAGEGQDETVTDATAYETAKNSTDWFEGRAHIIRPGDPGAEAAHDWSSYSGAYNGPLRGDYVPDRVGDIEGLSNALRPTSVPIKVGRQIDAVKDVFGDVDDPAHLVGRTVTDPGFMATSPLESVDDYGALLEMNVPAGTRGAWITEVSRFKKEGEFLLDKGQRFRVDEVRTNDAGRTVITVTIY